MRKGVLKVQLTGQRFGRLEVIEFAERRRNQAYWKCKCDCGNEIIARGSHLKDGNNKSCGCLRNELSGNRLRTHGKKKSREYAAWQQMKHRCYNEANKHYHNYGARGISVCDEWRNSFEQFYKDMGDRPSTNHSLDRSDNEKGYYKENCRWATQKEQMNNFRNNVVIKHQGLSMTVSQWSNYLGVSVHKIYKRLKKDLTLDKVFYKGILRPKGMKYKKKDQLSSLRLELETLKAK
jgi:hypothetical protein